MIGATGEIGLRTIDEPVSVHDLHATILHPFQGRDYQLTDVHGDASLAARLKRA